MGWLVTTKGIERGRRYGRDLYDDRLIHGIDRLYMVWVFLTLAIPFAVGYAVDSTWRGGLTGLVWGGLHADLPVPPHDVERQLQVHTFGTRAFRPTTRSRNNLVIAFPTFGEGWHNNHHAFPASAIHGLGGGRWTWSWWTIRVLERAGLAWSAKVPNPERIARRAARTPRPAAEA